MMNCLGQNNDSEDNTLINLTADVIKKHRQEQVKTSRPAANEPGAESQFHAPNQHGMSVPGVTKKKNRHAENLKSWRATKCDHTKHPVLKDDNHCFAWRPKFLALVRTHQLPPLLLDMNCHAPEAKDAQKMCNEQQNFL